MAGLVAALAVGGLSVSRDAAETPAAPANISAHAMDATGQSKSSCPKELPSETEGLRARILELESALRLVRDQSAAADANRSGTEEPAANILDADMTQDTNPLEPGHLEHEFAGERFYDPNASTLFREHLEESGKDYITQLLDAECREYTCRAEVIVPSADAAQALISRSIPLPWDGFYSVVEDPPPNTSDPMIPRSVIIYATHTPNASSNPGERGSDLSL